MALDLNISPYYDDYDPEKRYTQMLAIPGRVAQAREITQIQTILRDIIKNLGDSMMSDGDIIEGCQVVVSADKTQVTVTTGKVYIGGMVLTLKDWTIPTYDKNGNLNDQSIVVPISGKGTETIGVKLIEKIVTEADGDNSLRDPAQGYDNFNQPGCHRIQSTAVVTVNDPEAAIIATLIDGNITVESIAPNYSTIEETLARRTYDESGSYVVEGLKTHLEDANVFMDDGTPAYNVVIEAGKAYVLGYELKIPSPRRLKCPRSMTTKQIVTYNYIFRKGTMLYQIDSDPFVARINDISGRLQVRDEAHNVVSNVARSELLHNNVYELTEITQNNGAKKWVPISKKQPDDGYGTIGTREGDGSDCYLQTDGGKCYVVWQGTSNAPEAGKDYNVSYVYRHNFEQGSEYDLVVDDTGSYVHFLDDTKNPITNNYDHIPVDGTEFTVDYDLYKARKDLVYMDKDGIFYITTGTPDIDGYEVRPDAPVNTLAIALISNPPNGQINPSMDALRIRVSNVGLTRFTMNDIQDIVDRVAQTEYNQMFLALNNDALNRSTLQAKKGILTDPIADLSRVDLYYNLTSEGVQMDITKPIWDATMDLYYNEVYLPVESETYNFTTKSVDTLHTGKRLITLNPIGEKVALSQPQATRSFLINPYDVYPQIPEIAISPDVDSWIDDTIIEIPVTVNTSKVVSTSTRSVSAGTRNTGHYVPGNSSIASSSTSVSTSYSDTRVGEMSELSVEDTVIMEEAIKYMRQIQITVEGMYFAPNLDDIFCYMDDKLAPAEPSEEQYQGTKSGSLKADNQGHTKGTFTIPAGIRTGVREVKLQGDYIVDGYQTEASTLFQSSGIARTIQRTLTTVNTVLLHRTITQYITTVLYWVDPLAQTFMLEDMTVVKGVNVYFESKSTVGVPVTLEIRSVENGTVSNLIYASKTLHPKDVSTSDDSSKATMFEFDDPCVLEALTFYAIVLRSASNEYRAWICEMGDNDRLTGAPVLKNAYTTGVMMSSSNNASWTTHQTMDMKFDIIAHQYENSGTIIFDPMKMNQMTLATFFADFVELNGTSIRWSYSTDNGKTYYSVSPGSRQELNTVADSIIYKIEMENSTNNNNLTPFIAKDSLLVVGGKYVTEGTYVGANVQGIEDYDDVKVIIYQKTPAGTGIDIEMTPDDGTTIIPLTIDQSQTVVLNSGWQECTYIFPAETGKLKKPSKMFRLFINLHSDSTTKSPEISSIRALMIGGDDY